MSSIVASASAVIRAATKSSGRSRIGPFWRAVSTSSATPAIVKRLLTALRGHIVRYRKMCERPALLRAVGRPAKHIGPHMKQLCPDVTLSWDPVKSTRSHLRLEVYIEPVHEVSLRLEVGEE